MRWRCLARPALISVRPRWVSGAIIGLLLASLIGMPTHGVPPAAITEQTTTPIAVDSPADVAETIAPLGSEVRLRGGDEYLALTESARYQLSFRAKRPRILVHTIQEGDSTWLIAQRYDTDMGTIQALNSDIDMEHLVPGEPLKVAPNFSGLVYTAQEGDTFDQISATFGISLDQVLSVNRWADTEQVEAGALVFVPGARVRVQVVSRGESTRRAVPAGSRPPPAPEATPAVVQVPTEGDWIWPIAGGSFFSEYGNREDGFHRGLDVAAPPGTPVVTVQSGTVVDARWDNGFGLAVVVDHGNGIMTRYAHASKLLVTSGQTVEQGQQVILVGATGRSTGPHLHFEVLVDGSPVNPRQYLP